MIITWHIGQPGNFGDKFENKENISQIKRFLMTLLQLKESAVREMYVI